MTRFCQLAIRVIFGLLLATRVVVAQDVVVSGQVDVSKITAADRNLVDSALDCAMREGEVPWAPTYLRKDGLLRFTYLHELPKKNPGEYDYHGKFDSLYVAFWSADRTKGEFLDFSADRIDTRRWLTISNDGRIYYTRGKLDLDFVQGGVWMRTHYLIRLAKLRAAPVETVSIRDVKRSSTVCDSLRHDSKTGYEPPDKR